MLAHFSWFPGSGWTWYSVPDTIRSGMPVFYLSSYPSPSTVQLRYIYLLYKQNNYYDMVVTNIVFQNKEKS